MPMLASVFLRLVVADLAYAGPHLNEVKCEF